MNLISNSGIQYLTVPLKMDMNDNFKMFFHEWFDISQQKLNLEIAHHFSNEDVWVRKQDLSRLGSLNAKDEEIDGKIQRKGDVNFNWLEIKDEFLDENKKTISIETDHNGLVQKIDSLERNNEEILSLNTQLKKDLFNQSDSFNNLIQLLQVENDNLINERDTLSNELSKQQKEVGFCNKKLEEHRVTIEPLQNRLNRLNEEHSAYKQQSLLNEQKKYENGKQEVLKSVTASYKSLSFDQMIKASSEGQVKRDLKLVVDKELKQKLKDLEIYFSAKRKLAEKFNDKKVQTALQSVNAIKSKSSLVTLLHENLDNYKLRNENLKEVIKEIIKINARFITNTNNDQKEKKDSLWLN